MEEEGWHIQTWTAGSGARRREECWDLEMLMPSEKGDGGGQAQHEIVYVES